MRRAFTAILFATLFSTPAFAVSRYWTGQVSANWSEPANWEPAGIPTAADDLEFPGWPVRRNLNFDLPAGTSVGRMSFLADYSISGNTMTLTRDLSFVSDPSAVPVTFNNDLSIGATVRFYGPYRVETNGAIYVNGQTLRMGTTFNTMLHGPLEGYGTFIVDPRGISFLGTGTYSGSIQGNAYVAGSYPNASFTSAWLTGTGTTGLATAQLLSPGEWFPNNYHDPHTIGTLRTGALTITSQYSVDIVPGGSHDRVVATGTVYVGGNLAVTIPSGASALPGTAYTIIENDGTDAVSGAFNGKPEGATFAVGTTLFVISYSGGDGNDVVLTVGNSIKSWTGYTSANWSDPSNWSPAIVPVPGEPLLFPHCCTARLTTTNDLSSFNPGLMTFNGEYTLGGNELTLTDNLNFAYGNGDLVYFTCNAPLKLANSVRFNPSTRQIYNGAIGMNGQTLTLETVDTIINGAISGTGAINVNGKGLSLRSSGSFTGPINGIVDVIGSYPGATVTGARVTGDGTLGAVTAAILAPGSWHPTSPDSNAIGTLRTGPLSILTYLYSNLNPTGASDQVKVTGTVSVEGILVVRMASGTPADGQTFILIDNDGTDPVSGSFSNRPEGGAFTVGSTTFHISYRGGDGNDVVLTSGPGGNRFWNGGINAKWSEAKNWTPNGVPLSTADVEFPWWATNRHVNFDLASGTSVGGMTFTDDFNAPAGHETYTISGNAMTLTRDVTFRSGLGTAGVIFKNDLKVGSSLRFVGPQHVTVNGGLDMNGRTVRVSTLYTIVNGPVVGAGTFIVSSSDTNGISLIGGGSFSGNVEGSAYVAGAYPNATFNSPRLTGIGTTGPTTAGLLSPGGWSPDVFYDPHDIATFRTGPLAITSQYSADIGPAGSHDRVVVAGTVTVAGALAVTIQDEASLLPGASYPIIENDGTDAVSGQFTGLADGATFTAGSSTFRITYRGGDGNDVVINEFDERATTTTIAQNRATTEEHQPVTFIATVTSANGDPAGSVTFLNGSESLGSAQLVNGVAEVTIKTLAIGTHQISAMYSGSDAFDTSSAAPIVHRVVRGNPHVSIASSVSNVVYGDPILFSIVVAPETAGARTPTGTVTVDIDGSLAGVTPLAANGTATFTVPPIPAGAHTVTVDYSGDAVFNGATTSTSQIVERATTALALRSMANPAPVGVPVTLAVRVSPGGQPIQVDGKVVVEANGVETVAEAQLIGGVATVQVGPLTGGEHTIKVTYSGSGNFQPATGILKQRISDPALIIRTRSVEERNGEHRALVRIELTEAAAAPVAVDYRTVDGTAKANIDYVASQGTIVFNPGQTIESIPIRILGDAGIEPDETFTIELSGASGAIVANERATVVISNDDQSYRPPVEHEIATDDGATVRATLYAPAAGDGPWPLIVWIPGDTAYDGAGGGIAALPQTARGYVVISVAYRSAKKAPFPAQILDLMSAIRWMRANALTLNIDPKRVVAWGTGAGGHLAALLGTGFDGADPAVQAVVNWGGISDLSSLQADAYACSRTAWNAAGSPASQLIGCPLEQCSAAAEATAPARYGNAGDAPMLLMHGSADCFVAPRQSERLYEALRRAGVDVTLRIIDFAGHDDAYWTSAAAFDEVDAFLAEKLAEDKGRRRTVRH